MNRRLPIGSEPLGSPAGLDPDLIARLPPPLPPERAARMAAQRLERWQPEDAVLACRQRLAAWLAPLSSPFPAPLAIAQRIDGGRR